MEGFKNESNLASQDLTESVSDFDVLARQYEPMIHKIICSLHIYKNKDEFFQLGLVGLWEAKKRFNPEKGEFTNYAYTYIKGLFLSEMSKANKHEERFVYPDTELWEGMEDPSLNQPCVKEFLLSFCSKLTENQTKWVLYTCMDDLSVKDIAQRENVSVSAVKAWRKGAREKLKEELETVD